LLQGTLADIFTSLHESNLSKLTLLKMDALFASISRKHPTILFLPPSLFEVV
jgi:hypothetical protein